MKYFLLIFKHKWFVFLAGLKLKVPIIQLLLHDLSKFLPSELPHYNRQFFGKADQPYNYIKTWIYHQNRNKHHWEYWIPRTGHNTCIPPYPDMKPIEIPEKYVREMIADWMGAQKAYNGQWPDIKNWTWLRNNRSKMLLHPETNILIDQIVAELLENI